MPSDIFLDANHCQSTVCNSIIRCAHDVSLVDSSHFVPSLRLGIVECVSGHALACFPSDELDGLNYTVNNLMLNTRVFALGVLSNEDSVNIIIGRFVAIDGCARPNMCKQVEGTSEGQVEGYMAFANCEAEAED